MENGRPEILDSFDLIPPDPPNEGILFVKHAENGRSGHLGHALVEYDDEKLLAFYPNCSADNGGHSAVGWMEFKRSADGGRTWSESRPVEYSKRIFDEGRDRSVMSEKAVCTEDGTIVLFNLICDISENAVWRPYGIPTYIRSSDGGSTWTEAEELSERRGRIYDALYHGGEIFVLEFCNDATETWTGTRKEHVYGLYVSSDGGRTFALRSELPFYTEDRGYGTMEVLDDGRLIVYIYNINDEHNLEYVISNDWGLSWSGVQRSHFAKKIRNPQMAAYGGYYFLHGRSGSYGEGSGNFVLYTSTDGIGWDDGRYLRMQEAGAGAYSNNLIVGRSAPAERERLLIQASHAYEKSKTNVLHWWLEENED